MIYKNCSLYCNTFKQATFPSMKFSYVPPVNIELIKNASYFLPKFLKTVYHLIASTLQVLGKKRLKHFLMQPRVFNTWGFVQIFYSRKFARLVTMARWRKYYTAGKKSTRAKPAGNRGSIYEDEMNTSGCSVERNCSSETSPKCHAKTKELNHTV